VPTIVSLSLGRAYLTGDELRPVLHLGEVANVVEEAGERTTGHALAARAPRDVELAAFLADDLERVGRLGLRVRIGQSRTSKRRLEQR